MRVGLFIPCYVDQFYPNAAIATFRLLKKFGVDVTYPQDQTCCGQPMANSGFEHLTGGCDYDFGTFTAGPSKIADIEQSLVIGAHGARSMTIFLL